MTTEKSNQPETGSASGASGSTKGGAGAHGEQGRDPAASESPKWEGGPPKGENEPAHETDRKKP